MDNAWQPIETAPRDGTRVLAYLPFFWADGRRDAAFDVVAWDERAGFWFFPTPRNYVQAAEVRPTHWQPLPAPPTPQKSPNLGAGSLGGERAPRHRSLDGLPDRGWGVGSRHSGLFQEGFVSRLHSRAEDKFNRRFDPEEMSYQTLVDFLEVCAPKDLPLERPEAVDVAIRPLSRMPDCPLCSRDVNACRCDPDAYGAAVYAALSAPKGPAS